jgi:hypothetical protein
MIYIDLAATSSHREGRGYVQADSYEFRLFAALSRSRSRSWLNRIEAQFTALRYFALDGTDHATHKEQASMIRRYIIWRNNHAYDERLRRVVNRANVA